MMGNVKDDAFGLLSPNSCQLRKVPVNTNSLIRNFRRHPPSFIDCRCLDEFDFFTFSVLTLILFVLRSDGNGGVTFDIVFGPAYKGIPLGAVVSSALYSDFGVDVGFAYNRKEAKDHGEGGSLVGAALEGKKILIVDDVITAGTAIRESFEELHVAKAQVVGVVIALDRAEVRALDDRMSAVQAVARDLNIDVVSIVNLAELQSFLEQSPDYDEATLQSVVNYRKEYGAD